MTALSAFRPADRLLVLAPHPDDETLATGGLIQVALAAGCAVRVLILTDGDNNPWPQRWLERRWRIDAAARARWGQRRRAEARHALEILGLAPDAWCCFGWADLGLTDRLLADSASEHAIAAEIRRFAPTRLAAPVLSDRHPDHNALGVLVERALTQVPEFRPACLGFIVHGRLPDDAAVRVALTAEQQMTKQCAVFAHATQVSLSRRRLLAIAARCETYAVDPAPDARPSASIALHVRVPVARRGLWRREHEVLLVLDAGGSAHRLRLPLPSGRAGSTRRFTTSVGALEVQLKAQHGVLDLGISCATPIDAGFVKIERAGKRLVIYDDDGWHRLADCLVASDTARTSRRGVAATAEP